MARPASVVGAGESWDSVCKVRPHVLVLLSAPGVRVQARNYATAWARELHIPAVFQQSYIDPTMSDVRDSVRALRARPPRFVRLEFNQPSERHQNALLKASEEMGLSWLVVIGSAGSVLPTIVSRAMVVRLGLLSEDDLVTAMIAQGTDAARARDVAAKVGYGSLEDAHAVLGGSEVASSVTAVARALVQKDRRLFDASVAAWNAERHQLLMRWLIANASGHALREVGPWRLPKGQALVLWRWLCDHAGAQPRTALAALASQVFE